MLKGYTSMLSLSLHLQNWLSITSVYLTAFMVSVKTMFKALNTSLSETHHWVENLLKGTEMNHMTCTDRMRKALKTRKVFWLWLETHSKHQVCESNMKSYSIAYLVSECLDNSNHCEKYPSDVWNNSGKQIQVVLKGYESSQYSISVFSSAFSKTWRNIGNLLIENSISP